MRHADLDKRGKGQCVHEPLPTGNIGLGAIKPKNYYIDSHAVTMPNHNAFSYKIKQDDRPVELLDWLGGLLKDILF